MTQLQRICRNFRFEQAACQLLLLCLLSGAVLGAFLARLQEPSLLNLNLDGLLKEISTLSFSRRWFMASLTPLFLTLGLVLGHRWMFPLLFLLRGAFVSCLLCGVAAAGGGDCLARLFPMLFLRVGLPMPVFFFAGSVWMEDLTGPERKLWLLLPMLAAAFLGALLETLLV